MKKLYRVPNENKILGGVCLGLSEYLEIDVTIIRILFVVAFFSPIPIVISYIAMWIIMPTKDRYVLPESGNQK